MTTPIPLRVVVRSVLQILAIVAILLTAFYLVPMHTGSAVPTVVTSAALLAVVAHHVPLAPMQQCAANAGDQHGATGDS